ncbi:hypothetical protein BN7_1060 [Wickerhamomyces ciferrii]|uniref:Uncharacterized protein n=1 Tax=Wickerhamomyces ciferrii (strain ATCC 14091 / BCRC 22168 / CBS 111 / JCM 3599 / NBRC 0793 / NRRL Y-1031 F-60-10) TaxID=1206466 RepID=K0KJ56_WICCF|nr:uncharacterized protein BN7_1060 [Wickerhamomyces ciferrii]CCH41519.1 hypothetical protein BN7_1060 [Wickerhamomyces ciferrii]
MSQDSGSGSQRTSGAKPRSNGSYRPPRSRSNYQKSNFNRSSSTTTNQRPFSSISSSSSALPIDKDAAQRRRERFANDQNKNKEEALTYNIGKLREALLKFEPDELAKSVFLYSIRLSSKIGHYQTYVPSINFLLKHQNILTSSELNEITNILALHLAHFNESNDGALEVYYKYAKDDLKLGKVLKAWRLLDYVTWFNLLGNEKDLMYYKMMKYGESKMINHSFKCIQSSYFQLPKSYIDEIYHIRFEDLQSRYLCKWTLQGSTVVIRSRSN